MKLTLATFALILTAASASFGAGFSFNDKPNESLDILLDGKIVARYMTAYDISTPQRRLETYKPFLHVYDADGAAPITKGPGGNFTHHRGIFIGWKKIHLDGKTLNLWEMADGQIAHQKFLAQQADADHATFTSLTHWITKQNKQLITEERTITIRRGPAPIRILIDFTSKLTTDAGDLLLDGDPEHGGVQYRPAGELDITKTLYTFPKEHADCTKDLDYPWVGETYSLNNHTYSVVQINHPNNPTGTRWSAHRDYGRFGAFPKTDLKTDKPLTLQYQFLIIDGEMLPPSQIQSQANSYSNTTTPTPTITTKPADTTKKTAPKK